MHYWKKKEESISYLKEAIEADRTYAVRAIADESFAVVSQALTQLLGQLTQATKRLAQESLGKCHKLLRLAQETGLDRYVSRSLAILTDRMNRVETLLTKDSYFDSLDAKELLAWDAMDEFVETCSTDVKRQMDQVRREVERCDRAISEARSRLEVNTDYRWVVFVPLFLLCIASAVGPCLQYGLTMESLLGGLFLSLLAAFVYGAILWWIVGPIINLIIKLVIKLYRDSKWTPVIERTQQQRQMLESELSMVNNFYARLLEAVRVEEELEEIEEEFEEIGDAQQEK